MLTHSNPQIQSLLTSIDTADRGGRFDEMLELIHELEQLAQSLKDMAGLAAVRYSLACYKYMTFQKQEALQLALDTVDFCRGQKLSYYEMYAHNLCGIIYEDMSDYSSCLDQYLTGFDLAMGTGELDYAPYFLVNIGNLFMVLADFENSLIYLLNGFQGLQRIADPDNTTRMNMAVAVLNIIESYMFSGNYTEASIWAEAQAPLLAEYNKSGIAQCFLSLGRARVCVNGGDADGAERELRLVLADAVRPENFNDYYTVNILLGSFNTAIDIDLQLLAWEFLSALDKVRSSAGLNTFDFKTESARIRYFDRFLAEDEGYRRAKAYFASYYMASVAAHRQLFLTYTNSLHMRTELDRVKAERRSVQELNAELRHSIDLDPFTGVYNKMSVRRHIEDKISQWQTGKVAALLILDIDNFKNVNDTYGHTVGDRVIEGVAQTIKELFRRDDVVGRLGGDEFGVFFIGNDEETILARVSTLLERVRSFRLSEQPDCTVTLSVGVCLLHSPEEYEKMMDEADHALYEAKRAGRDRFVVS